MYWGNKVDISFPWCLQVSSVFSVEEEIVEGEGSGEGAAQAAECQQRPDPGQRRGREVPWTR